MSKKIEILTPENVMVEYETAGVGSRFVAFSFDILLQALMTLALGVIILLVDLFFPDTGTNLKNNYKSYMIAITIVLFFLIFYGYFIFFDIVMKGSSPGKKLNSLKVIKSTGEEIGVIDSCIRNILRLADFLPAMYFAGSLMIALTSKNQRIGDFAANTIVVKINSSISAAKLEDLLSNFSNPAPNLVDEEALTQVNIYPVDNFEYGILKEFMQRKENMGEKKDAFEFHVYEYFIRKFNINREEHPDPIALLEEILKMNSIIKT